MAQVTDFGLDGFAVQYLDGPEPVLAMLCAEVFLAQDPSRLERNLDQNFAKISSNDAVSMFVAGTQSYKIAAPKGSWRR